MKTIAVLVLLGLVASAAASCPNSCSGHGTCGANDVCTCWDNWQASDCSERTCAYGNSWGYSGSDAHYYTECSSKGICDRTTGLCECFPEYEGRACERSTCPNDCSGHGKCRYVNDVSAGVASSDWEYNKIQVCNCDGGFYGPDCSQRYCPRGDDPLTQCTASSDQVQTVTITRPTSATTATAQISAPVLVGVPELSFTWTDSYGEVWNTQAFIPSTNSELQYALLGLPNKVIESVTVGAGSGTTSMAYDITFDSAYTRGDQNALVCAYAACSDAGCSPKRTSGSAQWLQVSTGSVAVSTVTFTVTDPVVAGTVATDSQTWTATFATAATSFGGSATVSHDIPGTVVLGDTYTLKHSTTNVAFATIVWNDISDDTTTLTWLDTGAVSACTVSATDVPDTIEDAECSNRGTCDETSGTCQCFDGFTGSNCATQTILV